ncbi:MAG: flippase, partial [Desulfobacula sp.]|nr:flippase [Desulfobacula sp.]
MADKNTENTKNPIQGRIIARNTILNLVGYGTPLLVALVTIPILIKGLEAERFGVLTLVWVLISYIGLFDL